MLLYCNRSFLRLVLTQRGSIFLRRDNLLMGIALASVSAFLQYLVNIDSQYAPKLQGSGQHFGMHALGGIVGFAVVFRTNLGWQRYWEAVTQLHIMYSKWGDAYSQAFAFASVTVERSLSLGTEEAMGKCERVEEVLAKLMNNFILISAMAADRLTHGDTQRMEKRAEVAGWGQQIVMREVLRKEDQQNDYTGATALPGFDVARPTTMSHANGDVHGRTAVAGIPENAVANEWSGMRYLVKAMPSEEECRVLAGSTDRATVVMYWIIHDLAKVSKDLDAAPPIQSRMYQELSNGMLGLNQACKLADVPFPFPYAQMLTLLLVCYSFFIPVYITCFTPSYIAASILSFALFEGIWGLNETAKELENPFGPDVNDITLIDFHLRFVDLCEEVYEAHKVKVDDGRRPLAGSVLSGRGTTAARETKADVKEARPRTSSSGSAFSMASNSAPTTPREEKSPAPEAPGESVAKSESLFKSGDSGGLQVGSFGSVLSMPPLPIQVGNNRRGGSVAFRKQSERRQGNGPEASLLGSDLGERTASRGASRGDSPRDIPAEPAPRGLSRRRE